MNHFSIGLLHATKSGFYLITGDNQLRGWIEGKLWTCTKKRSWSLFGGLLPVLSTIAFWILAKPLHLRCKLGKSMRCTENCKVCSQPWSTERPQFCMTTPNCMSRNQCFKSWTNWAMKFCLIHHIHLTACQPTTTSSIWTTFGRENPSTTTRRQKMLSKSLSNPEAWFLCYRNQQIYFLLAKMCWLQWFLFWLIKMCLSLVIMI